MIVQLFPRLDRLAVDALLANRADDTRYPEPVVDADSFPVETRYAASGGSPIRHDVLVDLRAGLQKIAADCGFPDRGSAVDRARFDERASAFLAQRDELDSGEALRDDVWAFLACVLLSDLVAWRFSDRPAERFHGGVRNTFQRLWMRGRILDRGASAEARWELLGTLTEDALVQITERPSVGNDARLARALAEGWLRASKRLGRSAMEDAMREAVIRLRLRNQVQLLSELDDRELENAVDGFFAQSPAVGEPPHRSWTDRLLGRGR
ncbi:hypothetical protein MB02_07075 [Croceicoccus estronivorus]|uniref:DUF6339 family protein n=1 Tax=Croceicoccus estronivorus TaxID=1172626 RepID=UPI000835BFBB|nr:DUF6339 family protein [Croceicoccus estronivorus]OCC24341.1 hypothetical protein MB02_07075 [Croceicoccus estronivorus]